jgi:hypothetical protein
MLQFYNFRTLLSLHLLHIKLKIKVCIILHVTLCATALASGVCVCVHACVQCGLIVFENKMVER